MARHKLFIGSVNNFHDDRAMQKRQRCQLYGPGNMLIRKFSMCTVDIAYINCIYEPIDVTAHI